jgi:hypothetical protein
MTDEEVELQGLEGVWPDWLAAAEFLLAAVDASAREQAS